MKFTYQLNDNKEVVKKIREALLDNNGYCPCKIEHTDDTKCICREFRESSEEGVCHCGLYKKVLHS